MPDGEAHGHEEVKRFFTIFFKVFPDVHFEIDDFFAEGDKVAIQVHLERDAQDRVPGALALKERHVAVENIHIRDGKIAEVRVAFDRGNLIEQVRWHPPSVLAESKRMGWV